MAIKLGQRYAIALEQLLPNGWAWQKRGCDESLLGRLLRAISEELARFHVWIEWEIRRSIERFVEMPQGWSAPDYERLLSDKFAVSSPYVRDNDHWRYPKLAADYRNKYIFRIRSRSAVSEAAQLYLRDYAQSHTAPHITRDYEGTVNIVAGVFLRQARQRTTKAITPNLRPTSAAIYAGGRLLMRQTRHRTLIA